MSSAAVRLNGNSGIFGCGSSRKRASRSGLKFGDRAITEKGGTSTLARCCSGETRWHEAHHLLARSRPCSAFALYPGSFSAVYPTDDVRKSAPAASVVSLNLSTHTSSCRVESGTAKYHGFSLLHRFIFRAQRSALLRMLHATAYRNLLRPILIWRNALNKASY